MTNDDSSPIKTSSRLPLGTLGCREMTASILKRLEEQLAALPQDALKHSMESGDVEMAEWARGLSAADRNELSAELPTWFEEEAHPWHSRAAMELALRLDDLSLLEAAIRQARNRGVHDLGAVLEYPPWLIYNLYLLSTISRWPGDPGNVARVYLGDLKAGAQEASSFSRRLLGIRAWFTECLLQPLKRKECLLDGLQVLRSWRDARLLRSGLTLLHAYFAATPEGLSMLRDVLTHEEFAIACPELAVTE